MKPETTKNSFKCTGLCLLDPTVIGDDIRVGDDTIAESSAVSTIVSNPDTHVL